MYEPFMLNTVWSENSIERFGNLCLDTNFCFCSLSVTVRLQHLTHLSTFKFWGVCR